MSDIPTPKADALKHIQNFGEAGTFFSVSLGLALAAVYFRQLEIVLALAYYVALVYTFLTFENCPESAFFRLIAINLGVGIGIKELLVYFPLPVITIILVMIGSAILGFLAYRTFQIMLTPKIGNKNER